MSVVKDLIKDYVLGSGPQGTREVVVTFEKTSGGELNYRVHAGGYKDPHGPGRAFGSANSSKTDLREAVSEAIGKALKMETEVSIQKVKAP